MTQYSRNPAVRDTGVDDEIFLIAPDGEDLFYLNRISSGIWRALAEPRDAGELAALFAGAFPDIDPARIDADVRAALTELLDRTLIVAGG